MATVTVTTSHEANTLIDQTVDMLGKTAKDKVTGYEGVVSSVYIDLYGCVQVTLTAKYNPESRSRLDETRLFDVQRVEVTKDERVMEIPPQYVQPIAPKEHTHGPAERPARSLPMTRETVALGATEFFDEEEDG